MVTLQEVNAHFDACLGKFRTPGLIDLFENSDALQASLNDLTSNRPTFMMQRYSFFTSFAAELKDGKKIIWVGGRRHNAVKIGVYHETIHHILHEYEKKSGRQILVSDELGEKTDAEKFATLEVLLRERKFAKGNPEGFEKYRNDELCTQRLTEIALMGDKPALLEQRWIKTDINNIKIHTTNVLCYLAGFFPAFMASTEVSRHVFVHPWQSYAFVVPLSMAFGYGLKQIHKQMIKNYILSLAAPTFTGKI